jgi:tryptophan synthase beta chain
MEESTERPSRFGRFGGRYVAEALWEPLEEVGGVFEEVLADEEFVASFRRWLEQRVGRPTPVTELGALSDEIGGGRLLLKREDLCQTGSFTINMAVAYGLLARRMGREWLVGETATGDFGVALASIGAALGLRTRMFIGRDDLQAEQFNVRRIEQLGAVTEIVDTDNRGRKAAAAKALRFWATHSDSALYCPSTLAMPDPYPRMLQRFLSVIGRETHRQLRDRDVSPEYVVAPIGSGSLGAGMFTEFVDGSDARLVGVEAGGERQSKRHAASLIWGKPGVFRGTYSFLLQDQNGQILTPASIAGGLSVPNTGAQHAHWAETGEVHYVTANDHEAVDAVRRLARTEGILVALEAGHALAYALKLLPTLSADEHVVVAVSGRGSRDLDRLEQREGAQ